MDADYAGSTIRQTYITMDTMFKAVNMLFHNKMA